MKTKTLAFTLIEVIVAITVFALFIGFAVSAYLTFHRADQEALVMRSLMMEAGDVMDKITTDLKQNKIDYAYYATASAPVVRSSSGPSVSATLSLGSDHDLDENALALRSPDGLTRTVYAWDSEEKTFTIQVFDMTDEAYPEANAGYESPISLLSDHVRMNAVSFHIFPDVDPYDEANSSTNAVQFQPMVTCALTFATPGRVREEVTLPLQTTVTSRYYQ